jgi:hypothetical protein
MHYKPRLRKDNNVSHNNKIEQEEPHAVKKAALTAVLWNTRVQQEYKRRKLKVEATAASGCKFLFHHCTFTAAGYTKSNDPFIDALGRITIS